MVEPWVNAGYQAFIVDVQHPPAYDTGGITSEGNLHKVHHDLSTPWLCPVDRNDVVFVSAFPPCDHLAVSGARWFKGKGLRKLSKSIELFATAAEFCEWVGAPYLIENPVSNIASHWRKSDYRFSPHQYTTFEETDNYSKTTCLWVGHNFKMPAACPLPDQGAPDDRIHKCPPGPDRHNFRSATPMGFARAVFEANRPT